MVIIYICIIVILLVFSALFSATETVLYLADNNVKEILVKKKDDELLSFILFGNTIVNITIGFLFEKLVYQNFLHDYPLFVTIIVSVFIILTFGEILPKRFAMLYYKSFQTFLLPIMMFAISHLHFVIVFLNWIIKPIKDVKKEQFSLDLYEIKKILSDGVKNKYFDPVHMDIMLNLISLTSNKVKDMMHPYTQIVYMFLNESLESLKSKVRKCKTENSIVISKDLSKIYGYVNKKELLPLFLDSNSNGNDFDIRSYMRDVKVIYENDYAVSALSLMKETKDTIIAVHDEFFQFCGILDFNALVDQILFNKYIGGIKGNTSLDALYYKYSIDFRGNSRYETINDIVLDKLQKIPLLGDKIFIKGYKITILKMYRKKIDLVSVEKIQT